MSTFSDYNFAKVMDYPDNRDELFVFDFTRGYDADLIRSKEWGIGKYNEKRSNMYMESMFDNERNIHMGIDIWTRSGAPVFSFWEGKVCYIQNNDQPGDYGPTIVIKYELNDSSLYALYGHLSKESLTMVSIGEEIKKGQKIATLGSQQVNGGWAPHLHFQLSVEDPQEADMPGVVAPENREETLQKYPDPRIVLGDLY
ncbi:peptidoglycan DD-metalloendopeptidase family protein [Fodinibius sp.]|uniref:peptidoglycan DD-metalloendopeptidase family protein n=1 Tax=Fodinibius sp. TaxID=1872440 RepID=UPI002ACE078C|nr:peptidoglycan DD-metalloendopeptidase family protein [Fodinibius sp.]MDZ7657814.1 peptidoglycan DD-metalloendopeptidase family protein [Fodinibius sp.]